MSPPAAWKRRLRCGLVGSWVLMRNGLRRALAVTVSTASSFAARMAARIAACCQRSAAGLYGCNAAGGVSVFFAQVVACTQVVVELHGLVSYTTLAALALKRSNSVQTAQATHIARGQPAV